jgi:hypothetical protein
MAKRSLLIVLWSCTAGPKTSEDSAENSCGDEEEVDGDYIPGWNHCQQAESIEAICTSGSEFSNWWEGPGCPSFTQYATHKLSDGSPWTWAGHCSYDGQFYDVVDVDHNVVDEGEVHRAVFSSAGVLVSYQSFDYHVNDYLAGDGPQACCDGHLVKGVSWGEHVDPDCSNATVYTAADFPGGAETGLTESADTATSLDTADTGNNNADTADTGLR